LIFYFTLELILYSKGDVTYDLFLQNSLFIVPQTFHHVNTAYSPATVLKHLKLGPYLAGLIEGDGSIMVPKDNRDSKGHLNTAHIEIVFDIKDIFLAKFLRSIIGGYITEKQNSCRLTIKKAESLKLLIYLINGYFRTPKIESLHRLIVWYNSKHKTQIPLLGIDLSPLIYNS